MIYHELLNLLLDNKLDSKGVFNLTAPNAAQHKFLIELLLEESI